MLRNKAVETDRDRSALFPLPFTPFEYYYYLDDSPEYPTAIPIELRFSGTLDRDHFQTALQRAVARHPMLRAAVDDSGPRPRWIADRRQQPSCDWAHESVPITHPAGQFIDLSAESGLRTWVRTTADSARVVFQIHHACCDGLSVLLFLGDFLSCYKMAAGVAGAKSIELDPELLRQRGQIVAAGENTGSLFTALRDVMVTLRVWRRILFRRAEVLAAPASEKPADGAAAANGPHREIVSFETTELTGQETVQLREVANTCGVTSNDLMLRDFLIVLRDWNRRHAGRCGGRLRVNVPVNVRRRDERKMPAANRIGFGFVASRPSDEADPTRLLAAVKVQTQRIKEWKLGLYFLGGLELGSKIPALLRWALSRESSLATAVLSNVGRFVPEPGLARDQHWQCGELKLERVAGVPPVRKLTRAAVIVIEYAGRATICLQCDPHYFRREDARELLDRFMGRLRETLRSDNRPPAPT